MAEMLWKPVVLLGDGRDMNCKAVVFDMDGVILDSEQLVVKSWQKTADKYGIEDIESFCMAALGLNREAAKKLFVQMYKGRCEYVYVFLVAVHYFVCCRKCFICA